MNKYLPLYNYLIDFDGNYIKLSFDEIEKIISDKLPMSARKYNAWWSNGGHIQANAWMEAGWVVSSIKLDEYIEMTRKRNFI